MLEVDGKPLTQTFGIARYLARQFGLAPKTSWDSAQIDEIAGAMDDHYSALVAWFREDNPERKQKLRAALDADIPILLTRLEKQITSNNTGWIVGDAMTWLDLEVAERVFYYKTEKPEPLKGHEELVKYMDNVFSHPNLKDYVANRKI